MRGQYNPNIGIILFAAIGIFWTIFPENVSRIYGALGFPINISPKLIRILGLLILLVGILTFLT